MAWLTTLLVWSVGEVVAGHGGRSGGGDPTDSRFRRALLINNGFSRGPRSMVTISPVQDDESGKPYRRLPTSSCKAIIALQGTDHSAVTQGMVNFSTDNSRKTENIETEGAISLVDEYGMRSETDACRTSLGVINGKRDEWGQNINLTTSSEEDQSSATKDQTVEVSNGGSCGR